jgi:hypothetical protein
MGGKRHVQRRDVAEADQQLGIGANGPEVEKRQQPGRAPAAPRCEHRLDFRVGVHGVEVRRTVPVLAGEVTEAVGKMRRKLGLQAHGGDRFNRQLQVEVVGDEARRLDQPDRVAGPKPRRELGTGLCLRSAGGQAQGQGGRSEAR